MVEAIKVFFLETLGKEMCVFLCSMLPVIELRGAIPMGAALGLPWLQSFALSIVGNMIPIPFILLLMRWGLAKMAKSNIRLINRFGQWLNNKAEKNRPRIEKYSFWGICLFVAIPLPMTGAWTGSLVCSVIKEKFWKALLSAFIGVLIAGVIMTLASYGVVAVFSIFA